MSAAFSPPVPMLTEHLNAVTRVEQRSYAFAWTRGQFADSLATGHWARVRLDARGDVAAYVVVMTGIDEMHLLNVTVDADARRQGLATGLVAHVLQHAAQRAARLLWLEVRPSNVEALALYAKLGFTQRGLRRGYYPAVGGAREDCLVLAREVLSPEANRAA